MRTRRDSGRDPRYRDVLEVFDGLREIRVACLHLRAGHSVAVDIEANMHVALVRPTAIAVPTRQAGVHVKGAGGLRGDRHLVDGREGLRPGRRVGVAVRGALGRACRAGDALLAWIAFGAGLALNTLRTARAGRELAGLEVARQ